MDAMTARRRSAKMPSFKPAPLKRLLAIACEVFYREAAAAIAQSPCIVDIAYNRRTS